MVSVAHYLGTMPTWEAMSSSSFNHPTQRLESTAHR